MRAALVTEYGPFESIRVAEVETPTLAAGEILVRVHAAGVNYVSINIGMDMNPLSQVMSVIGGFRATIAAHPDRYRLAASADDIEQAAAKGVLDQACQEGTIHKR